MTVAPYLVKRNNRMLVAGGYFFFCYHLRFWNRAANAMSNIVKANNASYVTIGYNKVRHDKS